MLASLFGADRVQLAIAPNEAVWTSAAMRKTGEFRRVDLESAHAGSAWPKRLEAVMESLARENLRKPVFDIVVANGLARFAVVPWEASARNDKDWQALAQLALAPLVGHEADAWTVRVSPLRYGQAVLACALPVGLMTSCQEWMAGALGGRLGNLQPVWSRLAAGLPVGAENMIAVCVEESEVLATSFSDGQLQWVRRLTMHEEGISGLLADLDRQQRVSGLPAARQVQVHIVQLGTQPGSELRLDQDALDGWRPATIRKIGKQAGLARALLECAA